MNNSASFTDGINNPMNQALGGFGNKSMVSGSKEFLMSNTIVAKVAFLLLVIMIQFVLVILYLSIISVQLMQMPIYGTLVLSVQEVHLI